MGKKFVFEPEHILTISLENSYVGLVISTLEEIIEVKDIYIGFCQNKAQEQDMKKAIVNEINLLLEQYKINTIIVEKPTLFTDTFTKYPDFNILQNVLLQHSFVTTLEDTYFNRVEYFMELPFKDWTYMVLNKTMRHSIDLFKTAAMNIFYTNENELDNNKSNSYYKAICLSRSSLVRNLMIRKNCINK